MFLRIQTNLLVPSLSLYRTQFGDWDHDLTLLVGLNAIGPSNQVGMVMGGNINQTFLLWYGEESPSVTRLSLTKVINKGSNWVTCLPLACPEFHGKRRPKKSFIFSGQ
jgi:hypothetical protein